MKNQQENASALPALLRTANGGDTIGTNSLCCKAAGIIAPLRAAAEARIPHEKLRGAALADATLNAQERPLAQPGIGYKRFVSVTDELHVYQQACSNTDLLRTVREDCCAPQPIHIGFREKPSHNRGFFQSPEDVHKRLDHIRQREINWINTSNGHQMLFGLREYLNSLGDIGLMQGIKIDEQYMANFSRSFGNTADKSKYNLVSLTASTGRISRLFVTNVKRRTYGSYTSESLNPRSSAFTRPACKQQRDCRAKAKGAWRREGYFVHRTGVELDLRGPHKRLPAATQNRSLITPANVVHVLKIPAPSLLDDKCSYPFPMPNDDRGTAV